MKRTAFLLAGAVAAAVAALLLALAALDVHRWRSALAQGDVRFHTTPAAAGLWRDSAVLPGDPARRLLAVEDDIRYREATRWFFLARLREPPFARPELEAARGEAQVRLAELARSERDEKRRSEVYNLLGALTFAAAPRQDRQLRVPTLDEAIGYFQEAVRLDRANEDAKYNLESALRRLRDEPRDFERPGGRRPSDDASQAGLREAGSGY